MRNTNKKGFTIVELVIVVAVIAILAAVLIPTFSGIIKKANESKDTTLVKNLNSALAADTSERETMQDALDAAAEFGYNVEKINASAVGNEILWDSQNDVFCYLKDGVIEYIPESLSGDKVATTEQDFFKIYDEVPALADQTYSIYLRSEYTGGDIAVKVGFDAGLNRNVNVTVDTDDAKSLVVRTNGGIMTVDAPNATILHYGDAEIVNVDAVANASYHEYGAVRNMVVKKGRVVLESTAVVNVLDTTDATAPVKVEAQGNGKVACVLSDAGNTNVTLGATVSAQKVEKKSVGTFAELQAALDAGEKYIVLSKDISATAPVMIYKSVILDGANHKITNTAENSRGIRIAANDVDATIQNLDVIVTKAKGRGVQVDGPMQNIKLHLDNCTINAGTESRQDTYGVNIMSGVQVDLVITDCDITAWGALNLWSADYKVKVVGGSLNGVSPAGTEWSYGTIVLEGNHGISPEKNNSSLISVDLIGVTVTAESNGQPQYFVLFNPGATGNNVTATGCTFTAKNTGAGDNLDLGTGNEFFIDGAKVACKTAE